MRKCRFAFTSCFAGMEASTRATQKTLMSEHVNMKTGKEQNTPSRIVHKRWHTWRFLIQEAAR